MGRRSDARQRLMGAACDLIWEYSYGAVTIDAICERAAVKKGSFYYFFASKSELAATAIADWWSERKALMETMFRRENPPLERLRQFLDFVVHRQTQAYETSGQVLGCPIYGLGADISTQEEELKFQIQSILKSYAACFEEAIRDAQEAGLVEPGDAAAKAKKLLYYYAGVLTQARIENSLESIRGLSRSALELIGAREVASLFTPAEPQPSLALSR